MKRVYMTDNNHHSVRGPTFINNQFVWSYVSVIAKDVWRIRKKIMTLLVFEISKPF